jgi:hypothetical protein
MKSRIQNQLNMVGACITVANSTDYKPVWTGNPSADFGTDMDDLVLQFTGSDAANRFQEAWKRARIIVDSGGGHGGTPPTPPPATPHP